MRVLFALTLVHIIVAGCASLPTGPDRNSPHQAAASNSVIEVSAVQWEALNPARGDKSPQAGTLWGSRQGNGIVPTGFLAKFVDGFSSPPHIHNVTYRAVVISGEIHNDDPDAAKMWMPAGSFWTQPKGETHITAARGASTMALVEIDKGPYLVLPSRDAFDAGERPINMDASNIVWVDPPGSPAAANGPKLAYLWGNITDNQPHGTFLNLPAGFTGKIHSRGSVFRAVVIKGQPQYLSTNGQTLGPGSYYSSKGASVHQIASKVDEESIIYVRTNGEYQVTSRSD